MIGATHTPGPWAVRRSSKGYPYQIHAPNGGHVKDITRWAAISVPSLKEGEANARLIAAAPTMLAALKAAQEALFWYKAENFEFENPGVKVGDQVAAAIAKATGGNHD